MAQLIIKKIPNGYEIHDTITDFRVKYYYYTMREAEQKHRKNFNLVGKKLEKFYIGA